MIFTQHLSPLEPAHYCMMVYLHFREKWIANSHFLHIHTANFTCEKNLSAHCSYFEVFTISRQDFEGAFTNDVVSREYTCGDFVGTNL